jgi:hypothetical protein
VTSEIELSPPTLRETLIKWEKLRLWYNVVMVTFGWWYSHDLKQHMDQHALMGYWANAVLFGVTANVFFTLGPAAECYWLGFRKKGFGRGRIVLFVLGLGVSLISVVGFSMYLTLVYGAFFGGA